MTCVGSLVSISYVILLFLTPRVFLFFPLSVRLVRQTITRLHRDWSLTFANILPLEEVMVLLAHLRLGRQAAFDLLLLRADLRADRVWRRCKVYSIRQHTLHHAMPRVLCLVFCVSYFVFWPPRVFFF
jgi:hypothetical protein